MLTSFQILTAALLDGAFPGAVAVIRSTFVPGRTRWTPSSTVVPQALHVTQKTGCATTNITSHVSAVDRFQQRFDQTSCPQIKLLINLSSGLELHSGI